MSLSQRKKTLGISGAIATAAATLMLGLYVFRKRKTARQNTANMPWDITETNIANSSLGVDAPGTESGVGPDDEWLSR